MRWWLIVIMRMFTINWILRCNSDHSCENISEVGHLTCVSQLPQYLATCLLFVWAKIWWNQVLLQMSWSTFTVRQRKRLIIIWCIGAIRVQTFRFYIIALCWISTARKNLKVLYFLFSLSWWWSHSLKTHQAWYCNNYCLEATAKIKLTPRLHSHQTLSFLSHPVLWPFDVWYFCLGLKLFFKTP